MVRDIRRTSGGAILDPSDRIRDVLDDNDFVSIVLESDRPNPDLVAAGEATMSSGSGGHIPEQVKRF